MSLCLCSARPLPKPALRIHLPAVRVRLQERRRVMRADDLVFVAGAGMDARNEELPDTGSAQIAHRMRMAVPEVMVAHDRSALVFVFWRQA